MNSTHRHATRAMNTDIVIDLMLTTDHDAQKLLHQAALFFLQVDYKLSRFRSDSELAQLNRKRQMIVSPMLFEVVQYAIEAYKNTDGLFNPLLGQAINHAGYSCTFDDIGTGNMRHAPKSPQLKPLNTTLHTPDHIQLDVETHQITLLNHALLDLGGIAKGWAVDRVFENLTQYGECCVNAGGDIRASATYNFTSPNSGWQIDLESPFEAGRSLIQFNLQQQAVATSGISRRWWYFNGQMQHHLIDPRTQHPSQNELLSVTVIADNTVAAEIATKTAFVLGKNEGWAWLKTCNFPALMVLRDGAWFTDIPLTDDSQAPLHLPNCLATQVVK